MVLKAPQEILEVKMTEAPQSGPATGLGNGREHSRGLVNCSGKSRPRVKRDEGAGGAAHVLRFTRGRVARAIRNTAVARQAAPAGTAAIPSPGSPP